MDWAYYDHSLESIEAFQRRLASKFMLCEGIPMSVFLKSSGQYIGKTDFHTIDWNVPKFELGYWLRTSMIGHGYATEAVNRLVTFGFDTLQAERLEIRCNARKPTQHRPGRTYRLQAGSMYTPRSTHRTRRTPRHIDLRSIAR